MAFGLPAVLHRPSRKSSPLASATSLCAIRFAECAYRMLTTKVAKVDIPALSAR